MLSGKGNSSPRRSVTSPRHDPNNRVSKSSRSNGSKSSSGSKKYLTEEEQSRQFVADEDKFVLKQSKKKADIRVREGRAKPIDYLAFSLRHIDKLRDTFDDHEDDDAIVVPRPEAVIEHLNIHDLRNLESDIDSYLTLEKDRQNRQYWKALKAICDDTKAKLDPRAADRRVLSSVAEDIDKILSPKTSEQLEKLEDQVKDKLRSDPNIDTDYWDQLLDRLYVWKAKTVLARVSAIVEEKRLKHQADGKSKDTTAQQQQASQQPAEGARAPVNVAASTSTSGEDASQVTKALYDREAARGVAENEEVFAAEEEVAGASKPEWSAQYQVRKPRYFNRVQMGYEWNKYNQTHYDHDNPPPKVVQGYKFNIFYPDLVDKTKAPTYKIVREHGRRRGESFAAAGEDDTCLIRFIAGPPYEDIAFRIVDREWDYSAKRDRGFKSSFDKVCHIRYLNGNGDMGFLDNNGDADDSQGILQLHFQFKKVGHVFALRFFFSVFLQFDVLDALHVLYVIYFHFYILRPWYMAY